MDRIYTEILRLGLERHVVELKLYVYTVLADIKPIQIFDDLRKTILKLGAEDAESGRTWPLAGPGGGVILCLGYLRAVEYLKKR